MEKTVWQQKIDQVTVEISEIFVIFSGQKLKWYCLNIFGKAEHIEQFQLENIDPDADVIIGGYGKFLNKVLDDIDPFQNF